MAISIIDKNSAAATSITLTTQQSGDICIFFAYNNAATTAPAAPAAGGTVPTWNTISNPAGTNLNAASAFWATLTGSSTSGTFTNTTSCGYITLRGCAVSPIGGKAQGGTANSTGIVDLNLGAVTLTKTDGTSLLLRFVAAKNVTAWGTVPAGWTSQHSSTTSKIEILTKNSSTSEDSTGDNQTNTFSANGGFRVQGVEVLAAASTIPFVMAPYAPAEFRP